MQLLRLFGSSGSALPGLIMERLHPQFLAKSLLPVQKRLVVVTGTNGKTTTTKMLVAALEGEGSIVVTNATGSNMTRGLVAALIENMNYFGNLKSADWFVFEVDEAYAPILANQVKPKLVVGLNVLRDQLDRYGEINTTAKYIREAAIQASVFVYNGLDPLLEKIAGELRKAGVETYAFSVGPSLTHLVANEQTVQGGLVKAAKVEASAILTKTEEAGDGQELTIQQGEEAKTASLHIPVRGFHNAINATAVVATLQALTSGWPLKQVQAISTMPAPFGRGERLHLKGKSITVALVKNPSGFMSNLETFVKQAKPEAVLFVVNDKFADGRDVSWLWDVPFKGIVSDEIALMTSGIRAYDMALRLKHDSLNARVVEGVEQAIKQIMKSQYNQIVIIPTYTALFEVRESLGKYGKVPRIW